MVTGLAGSASMIKPGGCLQLMDMYAEIITTDSDVQMFIHGWNGKLDDSMFDFQQIALTAPGRDSYMRVQGLRTYIDWYVAAGRRTEINGCNFYFLFYFILFYFILFWGGDVLRFSITHFTFCCFLLFILFRFQVVVILNPLQKK
ncbi:hypothetical protein BC936DRAFT_137989 [Jimgerdemannia flammicorona]|uniref:Uncharacterized protein n=1 Tax=Jimgerdemannia flammicorona TaxID=994334 RepID=A0A433CWB4_9FUNG|nr:hypothetical protein BC936DRAFT_137989 [Jimgerdemannia flammicorona]